MRKGGQDERQAKSLLAIGSTVDAPMVQHGLVRPTGSQVWQLPKKKNPDARNRCPKERWTQRMKHSQIVAGSFDDRRLTCCLVSIHKCCGLLVLLTKPNLVFILLPERIVSHSTWRTTWRFHVTVIIWIQFNVVAME